MLKLSFGRKLLVGLTLFQPSIVKIFVYRLLGADIGKHVHIGFGSYIFSEKIVLRDGVSMAKNVHIVCREIIADEESAISDEVTVDGESSLKLGKGCYLGPRAYINVARPVVLEDDVGMGGHIYTHGVWPPYTEGYPRKIAPVTLKKGAWVPPHTTILPGVTIGEETIIGTGAVVTKSVPSRAFAVGVPAEVTKSVDEMQLKLTPSQKERRIREILHDFRSWIRGSIAIEENVKMGDHVFMLVLIRGLFLRTKRWGFYYTSDDVTPELIENLFSFRKVFTKIIIISLKRMSQEILRKLAEKPTLYNFFEWIDLERYRSKRSWDDFFLLLRDFFRSYYGVRFRLEK